MRLACALTVAGAGLLTGCSDKANASIAQPGAAVDASAQAEARNAYIRAFNTLAHNDSGAAAIYKRYLRADVLGEAPAVDGLQGDPESMDETLAELEEARETGSGDADLDAAADDVLAKGAALVQVWTPLNAYFASKGFVKDRYARARAADADVVAAFSELLDAVDGMGSEFDRMAGARARGPRTSPKANPDALPARAAAAMALAKAFVKQVDALQASGDPLDLEATDAMAFELDYALDGLNEAIAQARESAKPKRGLAAQARMAAGLAGMLDQWYTYKAQRSGMAMSRIVGNYNSAIGAYNRTARRG